MLTSSCCLCTLLPQQQWLIFPEIGCHIWSVCHFLFFHYTHNCWKILSCLYNMIRFGSKCHSLTKRSQQENNMLQILVADYRLWFVGCTLIYKQKYQWQFMIYLFILLMPTIYLTRLIFLMSQAKKYGSLLNMYYLINVQSNSSTVRQDKIKHWTKKKKNSLKDSQARVSIT